MLGIGGIVRIFEEIEQRLVQSLKRSLGGDKEYDSTSWQAEKLRSLEKFRKENAELMQEYTEQIDTETRQLMQDQFDEGVTDASTLPAVQEAPEPVFFGVDTTKVNKLIDDMTYLEKNAETAALRMTDDVYRQTVNRVQLAMSTGAMTLQQAIDTAVKDFLNQGINCIVYSDGRRVNIADYVRMALRTTATRAALQGKSAKFKALGYDTVQVSSYSMCSKTCQPWQGRIYIEDTFSWWDGEVQEYPDGILWGKSNYCGKWFPLLSSAIERGLFHPNCRHTIGLWRDGDPLPESVDNSDTEQRYKLEQQQRALEREIRKAKRKVNGLSDPDNVRKAKAELGQAQKELEDFVDKVNTEYGETVLKPDYGRTAVYEGEVEKPVPVEEPVKPEPVSAPEPEIKEVTETAPEPLVNEPEKTEGAYTEEPVPQAENVNNPSIDNIAESGIIEETEETREFDPLPSEKVVPVLREDSKKWIGKLSSEERRAIQKYTKNIGDPDDDKFFARLNAMLRGDIPEDDTLNYYSGIITGAISKYRLKYDIICYRGIDVNIVEGKSVGDIYTSEQFFSTSVKKRGALNKKFFYTILAHKGSKGTYIELLSAYPEQREFLFDKGCKFRILSILGNSIILEAII